MSQPAPSYDPVVHVSARPELDSLPDEIRDRFVEIIQEMAETEQPTEHPRAKCMAGTDGLLRIRIGTWRAILALDKPELRLLSVSDRDTAYTKDAMETARQRRDA